MSTIKCEHMANGKGIPDGGTCISAGFHIQWHSPKKGTGATISDVLMAVKSRLDFTMDSKAASDLVKEAQGFIEAALLALKEAGV